MYDPAQQEVFYLSLLTNPGERNEVDYKSSLPFGDDRFSLKLIRHIIGMANARGGWIVIGYVEDDEKGTIPDPNHTTAICDSYDTTKVSRKVNKFILGTEKVVVSVRQIEHPGTKLKYPVIAVECFENNPFFCKSTKNNPDNKKEQILTKGALYVRTHAAETVQMKDPADWEELIKRCVQNRRDDFLRQFENLLREKGIIITETARENVVGSETIQAKDRKPPIDWINEMRRRALEN